MAKGARLAVRCADLTPHTWEVEGESVKVGGLVRSMAWDPLGERLAVIFKGTVCVYIFVSCALPSTYSLLVHVSL